MESVPEDVKQYLVSNRFDRLVILASISETHIESSGLTEGHQIFLRYLVKRVNEITIPVLNKDLIGRYQKVQCQQEKAKFLKPRKTYELNKISNDDQIEEKTLENTRDDAFDSNFYEHKIADLIANHINERGNLEYPVASENIEVKVQKIAGKAPTARLKCLICHQDLCVHLNQVKPGVYYPNLSNYHKHLSRRHTNVKKLYLKNKDIRTSFLFGARAVTTPATSSPTS